MRTTPIILTLALTAVFAAPPVVAAPATVELVVDGSDVRAPMDGPPYNEQPTSASCTVTATDGNGDGFVDGGEVLDAAVASGCISNWSFRTSSSFGRFVTAIDALEAHCDPADDPPGLFVVVCSWWEFRVNGQSADTGIDGYAASDGDEVEFVYHGCADLVSGVAGQCVWEAA